MKTHYRKVFKSDHLGVADLEDFKEEGRDLIFTVDHVSQEKQTMVAGRKIDANIAYFKDNIKPLVLNATNSKIMRDITGSCFIENWSNVKIQLYIDRGAKLMGEVVGGVRINPRKVEQSRPVITRKTVKMWENAKKAYIRDGDFKKVLEIADISEQDQLLIRQECANV